MPPVKPAVKRKPPTPISDLTKQRIRADLAAGVGYADIMRKYKVGSSVVSKLSGRTIKDQRADQAKLNPKIHKMAADGIGRNEIARRLRVSRHKVTNVLRKSLPAEPKEVPPVAQLPPTQAHVRPEYHVDAVGHWLVIGDLHLPYHDTKTIQLAVAQAKRDGAVGVLLNGDLLDSHEISAHDKDPTAARYQDEIKCGVEFLTWLRGQLPKAEIVFKEGNHDERLEKYVFQRAPALFGLEGVNLRSLLHLDELGVKVVGEKRVVRLGILPVLHGHEYKGGGGVNPARWLFLRARYVSMTNHFHRTSEHHSKNLNGKFEAAWSLGCACELTPLYCPQNEWNLGFAMVDVAKDGDFHVRNMRVMDGKIY